MSMQPYENGVRDHGAQCSLWVREVSQLRPLSALLLSSRFSDAQWLKKKKKVRPPDSNSILYLFTSCLDPWLAPYLLQPTQILIQRWCATSFQTTPFQSPKGALGKRSQYRLYLQWISNHLSTNKSEKDFIGFIKAVNFVFKICQSLCSQNPWRAN